jgi:amicoumacin kinase
LSNKGLAVSNAVPSTRGNMVEEIAAENGSFLAISYEMSLGKEVSDEDWNESLYEKWSEFLGKIHHATKGYHLRSGGDTSPPKFVVPPDYFTGK